MDAAKRMAPGTVGYIRPLDKLHDATWIQVRARVRAKARVRSICSRYRIRVRVRVRRSLRV